LRREPEAADKALAQADKNPQLKRMLWDVLGSAGSPTAQAALVRSIEDPRWDREDRLHQMVALSMVEQPTEATVSFLQEQAESGEQAHQARLGLGIAADRLRQREPKRADAVVAALVQGLENAKTTIERRHYLTALGNTRHPDALEPILGFVEASDPHDRSAAMNALRFQRAEAAIAALSQGMLVDRDASVRAAAVQSAAYPPASPALLAALRDCAERDSEESVRRAANAALTQLDFRQGGSTQSR
jgi:HEAT repeat protein